MPCGASPPLLRRRRYPRSAFVPCVKTPHASVVVRISAVSRESASPTPQLRSAPTQNSLRLSMEMTCGTAHRPPAVVVRSIICCVSYSRLGSFVSGIQSVTGWVDDTDLGYTLVHEHIAGSSPGILRSWAGLSGGRDHLVTTAVAALADARACGVRTIVDCTTFDLGRDAELLAEVARASDVTVIACSGLWLDPSVTVRARTVAQLADWFIHDLTEGMDGTTVRAGVIKVATEECHRAERREDPRGSRNRQRRDLGAHHHAHGGATSQRRGTGCPARVLRRRSAPRRHRSQ